MTRRLTVAERLAAADKDLLLEALADRSPWDRFLVEQAVFYFGLANDTFSANELREVLPELGHGYLGAAIGALHRGGITEPTGDLVPSTSPATKGHGIHVWRLSVKGLVIAEQRRAARREKAA